MPGNIYINKLRAGGERITPIRAALIDILKKSPAPLTPQELLTQLEKLGLSANKTTIYRQLAALRSLGIVEEVHFADRAKRYELAAESGHHHHLVCLRCQKIEDIAFPADLERQEQAIWKSHKFKVLRHSLEFFGLCQRCQGK
ncbi:MAG: Ferric uptake regulator-like protein [Candidatus Magasanikbacteria bacterium GW2011_GWA2_56_11]|uniref:Ferric uptake regulator-like protein n=1 Tax=Candidatus Magasanikbacteria bacterium GW2011_GWA2_56_11 TaxID=1619044 RepID=A0A0G1YFS9_9BACT|nr:MAG: Ferric uptake regulator-like protein [Candidatus Magasanikbacteria bacterium GW2011_GWA2_56_11]